MKNAMVILLCVLAMSACTRSDKPKAVDEAPQALSLHSGVIDQAKAAGVEFEFESDKQTYAVGEPITITVHAINRTGRDIVLRPRSTYPSLFDFGVFDNGEHIPWTLNMALNFREDQTVLVPAKSRIQWSEENIVEMTRAGDGTSAFSMVGKHVLSFGTGNSVEITLK